MVPTCQFTVTDDQWALAAFRGPQPLRVDVHSFEEGVGVVRVSAPGHPDESCQGAQGMVQTCSYRFAPGTVVTLEALPAPGSVFMPWGPGPCADPMVPTCQFTVTDDQWVLAAFRGPQPLRVDVHSFENGVGIVRVSAAGRPDEYCQGTPGPMQSCSYLFQVGTIVTLEALPVVDSVFMGWGAGCADPMAPICQVTVTDDQVATAGFIGPQPLRIDVQSLENGAGGIHVDPPGQVCANAPGSPQSCVHLYARGTVVTLVAVPNPDSKFVGWDGTCSGTGPCQVTVTDDLVVAASFGIANHPPVGDAAGPYLGVRHQAITFDGSRSNDPDGDPLSYHWDFGDGTTGTGASPMHAYATLGTFTVTLTVGDGVATSAPVTTMATITNREPMANAGPDQSIELGSLVVLNGNGSADPDEDVITYEWRDGGGAVIGTSATLSLALPLGAHDFTLTVRDAFGGVGSDPVRVVVVDTSAPVVDVTSPENLTLLTGVPHTIEWTAADSGAITSFDVLFSSDGGVGFSPVPGCTALDGSVRSCTWSAPGPASAQARVRVLARDASGNIGGDDSAFAIVDPVVTVTAPNTHVRWRVGSTHAITWDHSLGLGSSVRVALSRDSGATWTPIATAVPNDTSSTGSFQWTVTGPRTRRARVRVSWTANPSVKDWNDVNFVIR
jgi:PKD repeat protein